MAVPTPTVQFAFGADLMADSSEWVWTDVTTYVRVVDGIQIERGYRDGVTGLATPSQIKMTLLNTDGRWSPRNPIGEWYGRVAKNTPVRVLVDNGNDPIVVAQGYLDELPVRWDKSENYKSAEITASGVMRRLGQSDALASAAKRAVLAAAPVAYWPCEDDSQAQVIATAIPGGIPAAINDVNLAADSSFAGSKQLLTFDGDGGVYGFTGSYVAPSPNAWTVLFGMRAPTSVVTVRWLTVRTDNSTSRFWTLDYNPSGTQLTVSCIANDTSTVLFSSANTIQDISGGQFGVQLSLAQSGADVAITIRVVTAGGLTTINTTSTSRTLGKTTAQWSGYSNNLDGWTFGQFAVVPEVIDDSAVYAIGTGYVTESPDTRFARLCAEIPIPYTAPAGTSNTTMGPQSDGNILDMLGEVQTAEVGMIFEARDGSLQLRLRTDIHAQSPTLALDYTGKRFAAIEPIDDDQLLLNRFTASRENGSESTYETTGPLKPSAIGVYADGFPIPIDNDADLPYHAQWRVGLGTVEEYRYPGLAIDLHRHTDLIDTWLGAEIGDLVTIDNLPDDVSYNQYCGILAGAQEFLDGTRWTITLNSIPCADLWEVEGSGNLGRVDHPGSELAAEVAVGATSLLVAPTTDEVERWSATDQPFDLEVSGERVTLTAVTDGTHSFVAVGASASGVNASVLPGLPAGIKPGDTVVIFAACRELTSSVDIPNHWTELASNDPAALIAKEWLPYWTNHFEDDTEDWAATDSTFAYSTTQAHSGLASGLMTVVGSPSQAYVRSPRVTVTADEGYALSVWVRSGNGHSDVSAAIDWFDNHDVYISTSNLGGSAAASGTWEERRCTAQAPSTAYYARYGPTLGSTPTGETLHVDDAAFGLWPVISFTGGAASQDTSAQAIAIRNVSLDAYLQSSQSNASAANIAYPALSVYYDWSFILYAGYKIDDWTSVTSPGTEIAEVTSTAGNDHGLVWSYQIQTTATDISSGSFTVAGGTNQVSRGFVVALRGGQTLTVTRGVNGVVKTLPPRTPVTLFRGGVVSL